MASMYFFFKFMVRVLRIGKALFLQGIILLAGLKWVLNWPIPKPHGPGVVLTKTAIILATELQVMFRQMCWKKGFKTLPTKNTQGKTFWIDIVFFLELLLQNLVPSQPQGTATNFPWPPFGT